MLMMVVIIVVVIIGSLHRGRGIPSQVLIGLVLLSVHVVKYTSFLPREAYA